MANIEIENMQDEKESNPRIYELGFLLVPTIAPEDVLAEGSRIKGMIESAGGLLISDENPKEITLAYPMYRVVATKRKEFTTAYFGWIKFHSDPEGAVKLKKVLDADETIIRFMITKTVKESTLMQKRPLFTRGKKKDAVDAKGEAKKDEGTPVSQEELDKTIEELVIY